MRGLATVALSLTVATSAFGEANLEGLWTTPLGRVRLEKTSAGYQGKLTEPSTACKFPKGMEVLRGQLDDDVLTARVRVCYSTRCRNGEPWVFAMAAPVEGAARLVGAIEPQVGECTNLVFLGKPFVLARHLPGAESATAQAAGPRRKMKREAEALFREGMELSEVGRYDAARAKLLKADEIEPGNSEILNQIGITYYARMDLPKAREYYERALKANPDLTLAHYNLACVLAKENRVKDALRALRLAVQKGFTSVSIMDEDPDLSSLRHEPAYQDIRRLARANAERAGR